MKKLILTILYSISSLIIIAQADDVEFNCGTEVPSKLQRSLSRGYKTFSADLWPSQIIPYAITAEAIPGQLAIEKGIEILNRETNICLIPKRPTDEAYIRFEESEGTINTSTLGYTDKGTTIKLHVKNGSYEGTVMHEVLHSIGFLHEHQRPDRDEYINVDISNVQSRYRYAFNKVDGEVPTPYDYRSILHYGQNAFAADRNRPVITALNGDRVGSSGELTELDIAEVNYHYPTPLNCDSLYALFPPKPRFRFSYDYSGWCKGYEIRVFNETENKERYETYWEIYNGSTLVTTGTGQDTIFYVPHGTNEIFLTISNEFGSTNTSRSLKLAEAKLALRIFPNPVVDETLQFLLEGDVHAFDYSVWNALGQKIVEREVRNYQCTDVQTLDLSGLGSGMYFIRVETRDGEVVKRFLKE